MIPLSVPEEGACPGDCITPSHLVEHEVRVRVLLHQGDHQQMTRLMQAIDALFRAMPHPGSKFISANPIQTAPRRKVTP